MCLRNFSWVSRSSINCQSSAEDNRFVFSFLFLCIFSPAFMKLICFNFFPGWWLLALIALVTSIAITLSAWSWRRRYRPSPKAFGQLLRICCKDPFLAHSWQLGVSLFPHVCRFVGLGNTSYTDLMRNRISPKSGRQQSDHIILFFSLNPPTLSRLLADSDWPFYSNTLLLRPHGLLLGWVGVFLCLWHSWYAKRGKTPILLCLKLSTLR